VSRTQIDAAARLGVPSWASLDYEFVNLYHLRLLRCLMVPAVLPFAAVEKSGVPRAAMQAYGGLKEEVYLDGFRPTVDVRRLLGIADDEVLVVLRPTAEHAHYGNNRGRHIDRALFDHLRRQDHARVVVLPRTGRQRDEWAALAAGDRRLIVSRQAIDGPALICAADLVISSGGTMVREAAVLGVPAISSFTGRIGAVDVSLEREGRIRFVRRMADVAAIGAVVRNRDRTARTSGAPLRQIVDSICAAAG
jgi:predicted glycosyltransferase